MAIVKEVCDTVYMITDQFPNNEKYGLVSQINRAAVSITSNLAEGTSRSSNKDQAHFSQIAYSSLMEVICQLNIAFELNYIESEQYMKMRKFAKKYRTRLMH